MPESSEQPVNSEDLHDPRLWRQSQAFCARQQPCLSRGFLFVPTRHVIRIRAAGLRGGDSKTVGADQAAFCSSAK